MPRTAYELPSQAFRKAATHHQYFGASCFPRRPDHSSLLSRASGAQIFLMNIPSEEASSWIPKVVGMDTGQNKAPTSQAG